MNIPTFRKFYFRLMTCTFAAVLSTGLASAQKKASSPAPAAKPAPAAAKPAAPAPAAHTAVPGRPGTVGAGQPGAGVANRTATPYGNARSGLTTGGARTNAPNASGGINTSNPRGVVNPKAAVGSSPGANRNVPGSAYGTGNRNVPAGGQQFGGRQVGARDRVVQTPAGHEVRYRPNGRPGDFRAPDRGFDVHHGLSGNHHVEVMRADHTRFVNDRNRMFVQHPYPYGGHEFGQRSYYSNGHVYARYYSSYQVRGVSVDVYRPVAYYRPAFYGWAYAPWQQPVSYTFATPWGGYYGNYFTPAQSYPSASLWLTDYMVSQSLANSYAASAGGNVTPLNGGEPMSPDVKQKIADEVQGQLSLENDEITKGVSNGADPENPGVQRSLGDGRMHVFVAGADLDVVDSSGNECSISEGDAVQISGSTNESDAAANVVVLASKGGQECHNGVTVSIQVADLQEMQNHMRETIDAGLADLQKKQGTGGLPIVPPSANAPPVQAAYAASAPPPDQNVASEVKQQVSEADKAEARALADAQPGTGGPNANQPLVAQTDTATSAPQTPGPVVELKLGQTIEEVVTIEGAPKLISNAGVKKIYLFRDGIKVTFINGKSRDIQ